MPRLDPLSEGMAWASRIITVALGFALPIVFGALADRQFGSSPIGVLVGVGLGFTLGFTQLMRIAKQGGSDSHRQ